MFFDTGEKEMPACFGLPAMVPDAWAWLEGYLSDTCPGGSAAPGPASAFDADGSRERDLFAVVRQHRA